MIQDFSIDPMPGHMSLLNGYMGITNELNVRGTVSFSCTKEIKVALLTVSLFGSVKTRLTVRDQIFSAEKPLVTSNISIIDGTKNEAEIDILEGMRPKAIVPVIFPAGKHSFAFDISIPADVVATLPASHENTFLPPFGKESTLSRRKSFDSSNWNGAIIAYNLTASLDTISNKILGTLTKTKKLTETIDFPRVNPELIAKSIGSTNGLKVLNGMDDFLDYHIDLSRSVFGLGQKVSVHIHQLKPLIKGLSIQSVDVNFVQLCFIRAVHEAAKPKRASLVLDSEGRPLDKAKQVSVKQRVVRTILQSCALKRPTSAFKHFVNSLTSKSETWYGSASICLMDSKIKLKGQSSRRTDTVEAFSSFDSELITVTHHIEVRVKVSAKYGSTPDYLVYEFPLEFMDVDEETRAWVMGHLTQSQPKAVTGTTEISAKEE